MARFVSSHNTVSARSLKRRPLGAVVVRHYGREDVKFTRVNGGWLRQRTDYLWAEPEVVSSVAVARECNAVIGCAESWARVY